MVGRKVIVVEDDSALAGVIVATLRAVGCEVVGVAASGEEALDLVERGEPDVVVMDVGLAGLMDGIEAARRLRRRCGCPVIFHTAFADPWHTARDAVDPALRHRAQALRHRPAGARDRARRRAGRLTLRACLPPPATG